MKRAPNIRQIEAFKAMIEMGSVTQAAHNLSVSQPAVSKLLAHLEDDTELTLFERNRGRLVPTHDAMKLYESVNRLFSGMDKVVEDIENIRKGASAALTIGVLPALSGPFMATTCSKFLQNHGEVELSVMSRSSSMLRNWLANRRVDVAFLEKSAQLSYLNNKLILSTPLVCIVPRGHALSTKEVITPQDLQGETFIDFSPDSASSKLQQTLFGDHGVRPKTQLSVSTSSFMTDFVAQGMGVALVHPISLWGRDKNVIGRPFEPKIEVGYSLCWSDNNVNQAIIDEFVQFIQDACQNHAEL